MGLDHPTVFLLYGADFNGMSDGENDNTCRKNEESLDLSEFSKQA